MRSKPSNAGASYSLPAFHGPECVCWWLSRCWRAPHNFGQNCRGRSEVLGLTLRNFLAPFQRLPDDFVFEAELDRQTKEIAALKDDLTHLSQFLARKGDR